ncbi:unnamed protein product [Closterium sp. Yama58-4]|nr:unnamed protein product [Closterium sp. Yama58-4]
MASRREQEAAAAVLVQAESLLVQSRADNALALLVKLERTTPGAKGLAELLAVAQVLAAVGYTPQCPRCRRPIGPLPKDYVDWFGVLQVDARTDEAGIKKRYRQLALLLHPDKNKSQKAEAAFRYVKEAHTMLTDSNKRAVFDSLRSRLPPCPCSAPAGGRAMGVQRGAGGFRASQGASWAGNEAGRLQELREQAKARVVSLEREWEEKKEQWLRDFEQAKAQQQAQQQQEREEQVVQAEGQSEEQVEGNGEQEGEEETDVANGRRGDEESEGGVSEGSVSEGSVSEKGASGEGANEKGVRDAAAAPASQRGTCGGPSRDQTGFFEENPELVADSIWEQLADLVDDADVEGADVEGADVEGADVEGADVESEGKGRREGSSWSGSSGAEEDREVQAEERREGREKQAEQTAEERAQEEQGDDETVEVNLSSPDTHGQGKGGRQVERAGDKEGGRVADAGMERAGSMMSSAGSGSLGGNASADAVPLAAARASPSSSASGSRDLPTSFRATTSGRAAADAMAAAAAATEAARKVLERSSGSRGSSGGGKEGSGDVLDTLYRLRRDTQAVAASLDNLRRRLSARPAAVFPSADFPAASAGTVPGVTGSPPVQVPAS